MPQLPRPVRLTTTLSALLLALTLSACGGDDEPAATPAGAEEQTAPSPAGEAAEPDGAGDADEAEIDAALEDLEAMDEDRLAETLGEALVSVVGNAEDYSFADGRLTVQMSGSSGTGELDCAIATTARDGVGSTTPITLVYDDGDVDCG